MQLGESELALFYGIIVGLGLVGLVVLVYLIVKNRRKTT